MVRWERVGAVCLGMGCLAASAGGAARVAEVVDLEPVWSAHPVGFALLSAGAEQYAAYYDAKRQLTVAQRTLPGGPWRRTKLPRRTGWDSHNYLTLAADSAGYLHLSGDMHCARLYYLRTTRPGDISSLARVANMVGPARERRVTYPVFLRGPSGELIFRYRDGGSGNGDDLYNVYDPKARSWSRLIDKPLTSGQGRMNAYCTRPALGPDGYFHMVWVWRDTPDAASNHHPSYARSKDLRNWETHTGKRLTLPITLATGDVIDPVPPKGGVINGNVKLGFDPARRPVVTYHKYDAKGNTQVYAARPDGRGGWAVTQISDWAGYRWSFGGGGAIGFDVRVGAVAPGPDGTLLLGARNKRGSQTWVLDAETLRCVSAKRKAELHARLAKRRSLPADDVLHKVAGTFPGLGKRRTHDTGTPAEKSVRYVMVWETLGANRDRPRNPPLPPPTMLKVVKIAE